MDLSLIISIVSGLVGGNAIGLVSRDFSMGRIGNSLVGALGGGGAGAVLGGLLSGGDPAITAAATDVAASAGSMDMMALLKTAGTGALGGAVLTGIGGILKGALGGGG